MRSRHLGHANPIFMVTMHRPALRLAAKVALPAVCGFEPGSWEWVGGNESSIIAEWNLICNRRFLAAIPASLLFIGSLLGSAFNGRLADNYLGREKTIILSCPNIHNGFPNFLLPEYLDVRTSPLPEWIRKIRDRNMLSCPFNRSRGTQMARPSWEIWRNLYKILSIFPLAYCFLLVPLVYESPRWLLVRGRSREALDVLKTYARINGKKQLPANLTLKVQSQTNVCSNDESLWKTKWAAKRMVIVTLAGFGVGFVYYGVQLNVENLSFNPYFSVGLNAMMESVLFFSSPLYETLKQQQQEENENSTSSA